MSFRGQRLGSGKLIHSAFGSSTAHPTRTGCRTSWMSSLGPCLSWERRVSYYGLRCEWAKADLVVTDMLIAILNCCTKEELEEEEETPMITPETPEIEGLSLPLSSGVDSEADVQIPPRASNRGSSSSRRSLLLGGCRASLRSYGELYRGLVLLDRADEIERSPRRSQSLRASLERTVRQVLSLRVGQRRSRMRFTGSMMRTLSLPSGTGVQADFQAEV